MLRPRSVPTRSEGVSNPPSAQSPAIRARQEMPAVTRLRALPPVLASVAAQPSGSAFENEAQGPRGGQPAPLSSYDL